MKKLLLAATALAGIGLAAPAAAQTWPYDRDDYRADTRTEAVVESRIARLEARIDAGIRSREIDRNEAYALRRQLSELERLEAYYDSGGYTRAEFDDLRRRVQALRRDVRIADRGSWDRYEDRREWADWDDDRDDRGRDAWARGDIDFDARIDRLETRIDAGIRSREIDWREAAELRRELDELERLERRYAYGGYSDAEGDDLRRRIIALRRDVRVADRGSWDRYEQRDEWADWDDDDWDDRYGRGGPDEALDRWCTDQVRDDRGGIVDFLGDLFGIGSVGVGERIRGNLYAVPAQHRDLFRDGFGVYYRSDGRVIYEVDANTHVVTRICRMPG